MSKLVFKQVTVKSSVDLSPSILRLTLQGDELKALPTDCESGYIKLLFNEQGSTDISGIPEGQRPVMRTYTIRRFDADNGEIDVDFVKHVTHDSHCGFAARWAMNVRIGDCISIAGPGLLDDMNADSDWYFMAADMTSLPALSVKISKLPSDAKGYAIIKVASEHDKQVLNAPTGMQVDWITENTKLADAVRTYPWLDGQASVWCACEFDDMRGLRQYFRNERQVERDNIYISSYWKQGVTEDGHKVLKRQDAEEQVA